MDVTSPIEDEKPSIELKTAVPMPGVRPAGLLPRHPSALSPYRRVAVSPCRRIAHSPHRRFPLALYTPSVWSKLSSLWKSIFRPSKSKSSRAV
jgi:hypothetical protein